MITPKNSLVLLHGWGMNNAVWAGLTESPVASIGQSIALHPVELPGHGGRAWDTKQTGLSDWAASALERSPDQAVWLGWSLGGLVALQAALQAPKRVRALILMTATPRFTQALDWRVAMSAQTLDQFSASLLDDPAATLERFLALQVRGSDDARATLRTLRTELATRPMPSTEALSVGLELLREEDLRGPLPDVVPPTLWLFGERDTLVPAAVAERVALLMPNARARVIPGAAHAPFLSHRAAVAEEIRIFLDGIA